MPGPGQKGHAQWYVRYEAPQSPDGQRSQPRIGPYPSEKAAKKALTDAMAHTAAVGYSADRKIKLGKYLDRWHANRVSEAQTPGSGLAASTLEAEAEAISLYLKPGLGHIELAELRNQQIRDLYAAIRKINRPGEKDDRSVLLRSLVRARASQDGKRVSTRPIGESRIKRVNAVLSAALNNAISVDHLIASNPAAGVFRSKGTRRSTRNKPLLWTAERVEHWERTGKIPGKVMTWRQDQAGIFLDFCEASGERLQALFHLDIHYGMRRSELAGLDRPDMSVARRKVHIRQAQVAGEVDDPKSGTSDRQVIFDQQTADVLAAWEKIRQREQDQLGEAYRDSGRYFTYPDGRALRPEYISSRFTIIVGRYAAIRRRHYQEGRSVEWIARRHRVPVEAVLIALAAPLPPLNFHGVRHGAATMLLSAKVPTKVISEILGHASTSFTEDVYTVVAEELAEEAAQAIAAFVPRRGRSSAALLFVPPMCHQEEK